MRMPELELGSDVSVALIAYLTKNAAGRRDLRPGPQALSGERTMKTISLLHRRALTRCGAVAQAQQKPAGDPARVDAMIKAAFPGATAEFAPRLTPDETMRQCSATSNNPPKAVADAIQKREKATIEYPADGKLHGRLEEGRSAGAERLRPALHRLSAGARQWRQLLCLPSIDQEGIELRHARPEPFQYGKLRDYKDAEVKVAYEKIYNSHAALPCSNMPRFGANKILTVDQIKDAVALLMSRGQPGQQGR